MASYIKQKDPNHLVTVGWEGFFGPSSPHLLKYNPPGQVGVAACGRTHLAV